MQPDPMQRNSLRDTSDYEASYMMSNATLQQTIDQTHRMLQSTSACTGHYMRLKEHFDALLKAQENRAFAVRATTAV